MRRAWALAAALLLAGCVGSYQQKRIIEPLGTLPPRSALTDALIVAGVKAALVAADPDSTTTVTVSASDAVVTLRGTVRSSAARANVVGAARKVAGVKSVVDHLRIDPRQPQINQQLTDAALVTRIEAAVVSEVGIQAHLTVAVDHGVATLGGTVTDAKTKASVFAAARGTSGVRNVVDRIRVAGP